MLFLHLAEEDLPVFKKKQIFLKEALFIDWLEADLLW